MAIVSAMVRLGSLFPMLGAMLLLLAPATARAEGPDLFSAETLSVTGDLRLVAANGEKSWTDEGFGKARFGGTDDEDWKLRPVGAEAQILWEPRFTWSLKGTVTVAAQHEQEKPVDLIEAYVSFKPLPSGGTHISGKAGLYWPAISLEHEGAAWQVADMITPSAINSWIGEEVKVVGLEATLGQDVGAAQIAGTFGLFGFNDTAGTLLAFRGWALHDLKATAFGKQKLPPLRDVWENNQAIETRPLIEIDNRIGYYGKLQIKLDPVTLSAFYYANRGDPEAVVDKTLQWGWDTTFWNFGARIDVDENTRIFAQAMTGRTEMGLEECVDEESGEVEEYDECTEAGGEEDEEYALTYWVDTRFRSAYVRVSHDIGAVTLSGRFDWFETKARGSWKGPGEEEDGWAVTADVDWKLSERISVLGEVLHIDSERGERARIGVEPHQKQTVVQASIRFSF